MKDLIERYPDSTYFNNMDRQLLLTNHPYELKVSNNLEARWTYFDLNIVLYALPPFFSIKINGIPVGQLEAYQVEFTAKALHGIIQSYVDFKTPE